MSNSKTSADTGAGNRTGVYLAVLQLVFTLGWTTYVIYLPKLCAQVGIAPSYVIFILMLDQAIFTITGSISKMRHCSPSAAWQESEPLPRPMTPKRLVPPTSDTFSRTVTTDCAMGLPGW